MPLSSPDQPSTSRAVLKTSSDPVAVVGGSAAGLFTAYLLARASVPVRVFEQSSSIDPAARTLIVTRRMNDILGEVGSQSIVNEIRKFELFTDGRAASITLDQPDLIIERSALIHSLAKHAREAGAQIALGTNFRGLNSKNGKITLDLEHAAENSTEQFSAQTVVAADGASSRVAQAAGWGLRAPSTSRPPARRRRRPAGGPWTPTSRTAHRPCPATAESA